MMGAYHILAAVLFLVVVIREGLALKCVQCNSFTKPECDSQPSEFEDDCPFNATSCRKMEQEIYYDDDYQVRTIRQCALESGPLKCIERTGTYRFKVYYCHCQGDNCNTASSLTLSVTLALVSAAVASLFKL
ncbi:UPAR/Ly6 domain-containing protein crok-like [Littorina saxatilis]|uniref:Protein sleepless n=1 Tax=Littorina saxatilis TaxID=31220 RepID=A0AAN9GM40_9CAEN